MREFRERRRPLSSTIFISAFVGVLFLSASFYYFSYKFTSFKHIDFSKHHFYTASGEVFEPKDEYYALLIVASTQGNLESILNKATSSYNTLLIDADKNELGIDGNVTILRGGINKIVTLVRVFNIEKIPAFLVLKRDEKGLYKQQGKIRYFF